MNGADYRTCVVCNQTVPLDRFYASGHGNGRRWTCIPCCQEQDNRKRRQRGASRRHQRYNARGHVWCNRCKRYLPRDSFKPHPSRPGKLWSYCRACTREIDRERYARSMSDLDRAERELERRNQNKRKHARRRDRERRAFVADAIDLLRRRGLTKAEIIRLVDTSWGSMIAWERQERKVSPTVADRFAIVIRETGHLPRQDRPDDHRRKPHPQMDALLARCLPQVRSHYVRSRWQRKDAQP